MLKNKISLFKKAGFLITILKAKDGQAVVEYSLLIGIIIAAVIILSPMVKRVTQGMVKIVADEVGVQENAEQRGDAGLRASEIKTSVDQKTTRQEWRTGSTHSVQQRYDDSTSTETTTNSSLGIRPN